MNRRLLGFALAGIFVLTAVFPANLWPFESSNDTGDEPPAESPSGTPTSAVAAPILTTFTGAGENQTVRVFLENSTSVSNANGTITLDAPSENSYLTDADVKFLFDRNYNTTYELEDDSALDHPRNVTRAAWHAVNDYPGQQVNGSITGDVADLQDSDVSTHINLTSGTFPPAGQMANFSVVANFSGIVLRYLTFPDLGDYYDYDFSKALGLQFRVAAKTNLTQYGDLTVSAWDWLDGGWDVVGTASLNGTAAEFSERFVNENLRYVNASECALFHVNFAAPAAFNLTMFELNASAVLALEVPVGGDNWAALEFDLKGDVVLRGAGLWVRTLNTSFTGAGQTLQLRVYRANRTGIRVEQNPSLTGYHVTRDTGVYCAPDWGDLVAQATYVNYTGDGFVYFNFTGSPELNLSNYFVVVNSTDPNYYSPRYSVVVIPRRAGESNEWAQPEGDPDQTIDHLLIQTSDGGTWERKYLQTNVLAQPCDASPFVLNVTRRWTPQEVDASIQGIPVAGYSNSSYPYNETTPFTWGLGRWNEQFPTPVQNLGDSFQVDLAWNSSRTQSLFFNATITTQAYSVEEATSKYLYNLEKVNWELNYTLDLSKYSQANWTYRQFWYLYPNDWTTLWLVRPGYQPGNSSARPQANLTAFGEYNVMYADQGEYSLTLYSPNYVKSVETFLNFNGTYFWPSDSFMVGDNVTASIGVQDSLGRKVSTGVANATVYDYGGQVVPGSASLGDADVDREENSAAIYEFGRQNLLEITSPAFPRGIYRVLAHWNNGSEAGCSVHELSVTEYQVKINDVTRGLTDSTKNLLKGSLWGINATSDVYDLFVASANHTSTSGLSVDQYGINQTDRVTLGQVQVREFLQNETLLNPGEDVEFNFTIKNLDLYLSSRVKVLVKLKYLSKPEWVLTSIESPVMELNFSGTDEDTRVLNFTATLPVQYGENCPLRFGGINTTVEVFTDKDVLLGSYAVTKKFSLFTSLSEAAYDGYLLKASLFEDQDGQSFFSGFERGVECNVPGDTDYFVSVMDAEGLTNYELVNGTFHSKADVNATDLEVTPEKVNWNGVVNVTGRVVDELGAPFGGMALQLEKRTKGGWQAATTVDDVTSVQVNQGGSFSFEVNVSTLTEFFDNRLRLTWAGDSEHLPLYQEVAIPVNFFSHSLEVRLEDADSFEGNQENRLVVVVTNRGNSTLVNITLSNLAFGGYDVSELAIDYGALASLAPGGSISLEYEVSVPRLSSSRDVNFSVTLEAWAFETGEYYESRSVIEVRVARGPFFGANADLALFGYFSLVVVSWLALAFHVVRHRQRLREESEAALREKEEGPRARAKRRRRAARKVAAEAIKPSEPKEPPKPAAAGTSLDELLEEKDGKRKEG
ncbi:MAG: hypothetical protein Kow0069_11280 [Promethearchaeota archaeon]